MAVDLFTATLIYPYAQLLYRNFSALTRETSFVYDDSSGGKYGKLSMDSRNLGGDSPNIMLTLGLSLQTIVTHSTAVKAELLRGSPTLLAHLFEDLGCFGYVRFTNETKWYKDPAINERYMTAVKKKKTSQFQDEGAEYDKS